jgi:hypothetical protein
VRGERLEGPAPGGGRGPFDVVGFLQSGDMTMLGGLSPTRAAAARKLWVEWDRLRGLVSSLAMRGDDVVVVPAAEAIAAAADSTITAMLTGDPTLGQAGGAAPVESRFFRRRELEEPFQALYGKITDPAARHALTTEVHGKLAAQMAFMRAVLAEGRGAVWDWVRDQNRGFMVRLGDPKSPQDRKRYGGLTGAYVTREFHELLHPPRTVGPAVRILLAPWTGLVSAKRMVTVLTPRTIVRNWYTSVLTNALRTGDATHLAFWKHWGRAHAIAVGYAAGRPWAMREMEEAVRAGVFRPGSGSNVFDVEAALGALPTKAGAAARKVTRAYVMIDFMTKYAAWKTQIGLGVAPEQAAAHVQRLYQNADRVPRAIKAWSATGMADFAGFTADSVRFTAEQVQYAGEQARKGNMRPLVGWMLSSLLWTVLAERARKRVTVLWAKAHGRMRGEVNRLADVEAGAAAAGGGGPGTGAVRAAVEAGGKRPGFQGEMDEMQLAALRTMLPRYDRAAPVLGWYERKADGREAIYYTIIGGQTGAPVEDWMVGALEARRSGSTVLGDLLRQAGEQLGPGMVPEMVYRTATGKDFEGRPIGETKRGLVDVAFGTPDPRNLQTLREIGESLGVDLLPGGVAVTARRVRDIREAERAGQDRGVGMYANTATVEDAAWAAVRLIRTYRVERSDFNRRTLQAIQPYADMLKAANATIRDERGAALVRRASTPTQQQAAAVAEERRQHAIGNIRRILTDAKTLAPSWMDTISVGLILHDAGVDAPAQFQATTGAAMPYIPEPPRRIQQWMRY